MQQELVDLLGREAVPGLVVREDEGGMEALLCEEKVDFEVGRNVEEMVVAVAPPGEVHQDAVPNLMRDDEETLVVVQRGVELRVDLDGVSVSRGGFQAVARLDADVEAHAFNGLQVPEGEGVVVAVGEEDGALRVPVA